MNIFDILNSKLLYILVALGLLIIFLIMIYLIYYITKLNS